MDIDKLLHIGNTFEFQIMDELRVSFPDAVLMHDLRLYSTFLKTDTQIDIVAITKFGVFVIEAKNWKHWVKGSYDDFNWTGLSSNRKIMTVFNPVHQNFIHIRALRNKLRVAGYSPATFHNFVVVPDGTQINSNCSEVVNLSILIRKLQQIANDTQKIMDVQEMYQVIDQVV